MPPTCRRFDEALKSLGDGTQPLGGSIQRPAASSQSPAVTGSSGSAVAQTRMPLGSASGQTMRLVEAASPAPFIAPPEPAVEAPPAVPVKSLADIAALADTNRDMLFKTQFKNCIRLVRIEPGRVDVSLTADAPRSLVTDLSARLEKWTGRRWMVSVSREEGGQTLAEMELAKRDTAILDAKSDPAVAAILARFPGAKIIDVRIPDAPDAASGEVDLPPEAAVEDDEETDL